MIPTTNPATEQLIAEYPEHSPDHVTRALRQAYAAFLDWRTTSFDHRSALLKRAASLLRDRRASLARLMTDEMGKPIVAAEAEIDKCAGACDFFADHAAEFLQPHVEPTDASRSFVRYDPLGPVLAVMPWNFPFWQVFRFAAPALMAGNSALLKHASNVPGCALAIESIFRDAGFPPALFTTLLISSTQLKPLIHHPAIAAVTLTGSETAGIAVASEAGRALKKTVLELGGSDPFIVLADVDIPAVARAAAHARCINAGQSCIAAKRFIVHHSIVEPFQQALVTEMARLVVGDPSDRATDVGPLARLDLLTSLHDQVQRSLAQGARLLAGGHRLARTGFYYAPTVLSHVSPGMPAFDEETFGPVAAVTSATDIDDAIRLANASRYGLGASLWTRDTALAESLAPRIDAGCVFINGPVKSDPRLPFGGIKSSGYGRELAQPGIREFTNTKSVWIK